MSPSNNETRPSRDRMFAMMAVVVAQRSTCCRRKVGVVITNNDGTQVVGMGYNGNARGLANTCDTTLPGQCGCIHAEINALVKTPYDRGLLTMYTTLAPCLACAKLLLNSSVRRICYMEEYRDYSGLLLLRQQKIDVVCIPSGLVWHDVTVMQANQSTL